MELQTRTEVPREPRRSSTSKESAGRERTARSGIARSIRPVRRGCRKLWREFVSQLRSVVDLFRGGLRSLWRLPGDLLSLAGGSRSHRGESSGRRSIDRIADWSRGKFSRSCRFCAVKVRAENIQWYQFYLALVLHRPYECPHCFETSIRPDHRRFRALTSLFSRKEATRKPRPLAPDSDVLHDDPQEVGTRHTEEGSLQTVRSGSGSNRNRKPVRNQRTWPACIRRSRMNCQRSRLRRRSRAHYNGRTTEIGRR